MLNTGWFWWGITASTGSNITPILICVPFLYSLQTTADEYTLKESLENLTRRQYRRPFLILNFLFILMTFSGNFAITFYAVDIFQNVSQINEYLSAVIIGIIKFIGALLYIPAIKYVSRRILICGSAFVMGIR